VHLSSNPALWYAIRASGVLAFVFLTCTVLVGVGLAGKLRLARWPRFTVDALHRYLGTLFWVFLGHRRDGIAARARDREPAARQALVPFLASRALPQLRGLGGLDVARHVHRAPTA
jgi:methionine sulfoxide reductase heme-binding subunit